MKVLLLLLQKMDFLLTKITSQMMQNHILPMICASLEAPSVQIQDLCLSIIPTFADQLEASSMKNSILPRIKKIVLEGSTAAVGFSIKRTAPKFKKQIR